MNRPYLPRIAGIRARINHIPETLIPLLCLSSAILLLRQASLVSACAREGIRLWAYSVLPVLLPFIILTKVLILCRVPQWVLMLSRKLFPCSRYLAAGLPLMLIGLMAGFPIGAILVRHFYEEGLLSKKEAETLLPLCSLVSPMFLTGYVRPLYLNCFGSLVSSQTEHEWRIQVFCLYAPLILLYVICIGTELCYHLTEKSGYARQTVSFCRSSAGKKEDSSSLSDIFSSALEIIFTIGIYMMLFSILLGLSRETGLFAAEPVQILMSGLEVTSGCNYILTQLEMAYPFTDPGLIRQLLLLVVLETGGLCTLAQISTVLEGSGLSLAGYIRTRLLATALALFLYTLIRLIL